MAKLPAIKRLAKEDFPELPWAEKLFTPINQFFLTIYSAINRNLTITDNFAAQTHEFDFQENLITYPLKFAWNQTRFPTDLIVTKVTVVDQSNPTGAVFAQWNFDGTSINVTKFYGIDATKQVKIRVLAIGN